LVDYIRHIWERHSHLLVLTAVLIAGFFVLYALRTVLLPFFLGFLMAYLLMPLISWIEKPLPHQGRWLEAKRASIILLFYLVILTVIGVIAFVLFGVVSNAFATLVENAPQYYVGAV
jgi:predicted PurR-regulated permease PerM